MKIRGGPELKRHWGQSWFPISRNRCLLTNAKGLPERSRRQQRRNRKLGLRKRSVQITPNAVSARVLRREGTNLRTAAFRALRLPTCAAISRASPGPYTQDCLVDSRLQLLPVVDWFLRCFKWPPCTGFPQDATGGRATAACYCIQFASLRCQAPRLVCRSCDFHSSWFGPK